MRKQSITVFLLFSALPYLSGCDTGTQTSQRQDIAEITWQADGNAIFGFIQAYTLTQNTGVPPLAYNIAKFNTDGSLAQTYKTDPKSRPDDLLSGIFGSYAPNLFVSSD